MSEEPLIPNAETQRAIADGRARKCVTIYKSVAAWRKSLIAVSAKERKPAETELAMKTEAGFSGEL
jgi:hypothetical protein